MYAKVTEINIYRWISRPEALINLLDEKGIISRQELLEEMKRVQASMIKSKA